MHRREDRAGRQGKKIVVIVERARGALRAFRDADIADIWLPPQPTHMIPGVDVGHAEPFCQPMPLVPVPSPAPRAAREGTRAEDALRRSAEFDHPWLSRSLGQIAWPRRTGLRDPDRWRTGGPWLNWVLRCCSDHIGMLTVVSFKSDVFLSTRYGHILPAAENLVSAMLKNSCAEKPKSMRYRRGRLNSYRGSTGLPPNKKAVGGT
jgi:hypothetical protein